MWNHIPSLSMRSSTFFTPSLSHKELQQPEEEGGVWFFISEACIWTACVRRAQICCWKCGFVFFLSLLKTKENKLFCSWMGESNAATHKRGRAICTCTIWYNHGSWYRSSPPPGRWGARVTQHRYVREGQIIGDDDKLEWAMLLSPRPLPCQGWPCREGNPLLPLH